MSAATMLRRARSTPFLLGGAALAALALAGDERRPRLVWNASASAPVGLYRVVPAGRFSVGDLVAVRPEGAVRTWLSERRHPAAGAALLKRIAALPGSTVCRHGEDILIDARTVARAQRRDRLYRRLPDWQGCRKIAVGELFLLNAGVPDSLDGRYFGVTDGRHILGRALPLRTRGG